MCIISELYIVIVLSIIDIIMVLRLTVDVINIVIKWY